MLEKVKSSIMCADDGYYVFWPKAEQGAYTPDNLRIIADHIDELNKDWDNQIKEYFKNEDQFTKLRKKTT